MSCCAQESDGKIRGLTASVANEVWLERWMRKRMEGSYLDGWIIYGSMGYIWMGGLYMDGWLDQSWLLCNKSG